MTSSRSHSAGSNGDNSPSHQPGSGRLPEYLNCLENCNCNVHVPYDYFEPSIYYDEYGNLYLYDYGDGNTFDPYYEASIVDCVDSTCTCHLDNDGSSADVIDLTESDCETDNDERQQKQLEYAQSSNGCEKTDQTQWTKVTKSGRDCIAEDATGKIVS